MTPTSTARTSPRRGSMTIHCRLRSFVLAYNLNDTVIPIPFRIPELKAKLSHATHSLLSESGITRCLSVVVASRERLDLSKTRTMPDTKNTSFLTAQYHVRKGLLSGRNSSLRFRFARTMPTDRSRQKEGDSLRAVSSVSFENICLMIYVRV
jgi:hypothetical protein